MSDKGKAPGQQNAHGELCKGLQSSERSNKVNMKNIPVLLLSLLFVSGCSLFERLPLLFDENGQPDFSFTVPIYVWGDTHVLRVKANGPFCDYDPSAIRCESDHGKVLTPGEWFVMQGEDKTRLVTGNMLSPLSTEPRPYDPKRDLCKSLDHPGFSCSPNFVLTATAETIPWGVENVQAPKVWNELTGDGVKVAVIDTGANCEHEDLNCGAEYDAITGSSRVNDDNGHGTHCAGSVAAVAGNNRGVAGVAPAATILPCKFLNAQGSGSLYDAIKCVDWSVAQGARVISNSWGGGGYSQPLADAIKRATDAGAIFVAAAGNEGRNCDISNCYPCEYPGVVCVAATDSSDKLASFSNYGADTVTVAAPGVNILSTWNTGGYNTISGTSMATPHVSGLAALLLSAGRPAKDIPGLLLQVRPVATLAGKTKAGGVIDATKALGSGDPVPAPPAFDCCNDPGFANCAADCRTRLGDKKKRRRKCLGKCLEECGSEQPEPPISNCKEPLEFEGGNLWKPVSDTTGNGVFLSAEQHDHSSCKIKLAAGGWEQLEYRGRSNGNRQTWRADHPGGPIYAGQKKDGGILCDNECFFPFPGSPSKRWE